MATGGRQFCRAHGCEFYECAGLAGLGGDEIGYVEAAVRLTRDCAALRNDRALLRERMAASPLSDINAYVAHMETLFCQMWAAYWEGDRSRVILIDKAETMVGNRQA